MGPGKPCRYQTTQRLCLTAVCPFREHLSPESVRTRFARQLDTPRAPSADKGEVARINWAGHGPHN